MSIATISRSLFLSTALLGASLATSAAQATAMDNLRDPLTAELEAQAQPMADMEDENDPLEGLNRGIFEFNRVVDGVFIKPAAQIYRSVLPQEAQDGIRNFLRNLRSPIILLNNLLQGDMQAAGNTIGRFLLNTTAGLGGVLDLAADRGIPYRGEDFGQTLAVWGIGDGPYLMLPILGPSNLRDTSGIVAEWLVDPVNIYLDNEDLEWLIYVRAGLTGIDARARSIDVLNELERTSLDYYAAIRSLYRQQRTNDIRNSRPSDDEGRPNLTRAQAALPDDVVTFRPSR
ncbi:MAG TPA: VacJ family lipoprotein [Alphaproteobacteria bacterium]|nr:VacJ family lipoprotein [Alphaproteobacteria bacterium]